MTQRDEFAFSPNEFSGKVRLFPLPNLVLFPHVMQPLHIFEPRYVALLHDALEDDGLMAMAVLAPGWEEQYEGRPPIHPFACLGRVTLHYQLSSGAYNLLLSGLRRVQLVRELPPNNPFREAEAILQEDCYRSSEEAAGPPLHRKLRAAFLRVLDRVPQVLEQLDQLLGSDVPLGTLTDIISYMVDIDIEAKVALLSETNVYRRAERLLAILAVMAEDTEPARSGATDFPPDFSAN